MGCVEPLAGIIIALVVSATTATAFAEELSDPRDQLATVTGHAVFDGRTLKANGQDTICNSVDPKASYIRLEIELTEGPAGGDRVILTAVDGKWRVDLPAEHFTRRAWTPQVPGPCAKLENLTGSSLYVSRKLVPVNPVSLKSYFPPGKPPSFSSVDTYPYLHSATAGMPILFFMKGEKEESCSGFAVAANIVLTNHHCVSGDAQARAVTLKFGYRTDGNADQVIVGASVLLASPEHDATFLLLNEQIASNFIMPPWRDGPPVAGEPLAVVQHPGRATLRVSDDDDCRVGLTNLKGRRGAQVDFGHKCDTEGGSSGAMVVGKSPYCQQVVGLHHWGVANWNSKATNQAVRIDRLTSFLQGAKTQKRDSQLRIAANKILSLLTFARCQ